jgi:prevent-host-death family protein
MSTLKIPTAKIFEPLLERARYKGVFGGRGSGKSHFFAEFLVETCQAERGTLAVCIREARRTLSQSSKRLIENKIAALGLGHRFRIFSDKIEIPGDGLVIFQTAFWPLGEGAIGIIKPRAMRLTIICTMYKYMYDHQDSGVIMAHASYSELRNNLATYMDAVCDDRAPLLVTRQNARSVVLMSEEDYEGLMETAHLLKSPANALRLLRSIQEANDGKLTERELIEPANAP